MTTSRNQRGYNQHEQVVSTMDLVDEDYDAPTPRDDISPPVFIGHPEVHTPDAEKSKDDVLLVHDYRVVAVMPSGVHTRHYVEWYNSALGQAWRNYKRG